MPILPGTDGERRMAKSLGNYVGVTEPPEEVFGKLMRVPDSAMPVYYDLLLDGALDDGRPPVELKRAMARELTARFHGAEAAAAAEAHFDRLHVAHEAPDDVEELRAAGRRRRRCTCRRCWARPSGSRARRPAGCWSRAACGWTASRSAGELDLPAERLDGALLQVGKRRFRRLRKA